MDNNNRGANSYSALASIVFAVILWSTSFAAIKAGMGGLPPISFAALRFVFASVILLGIRMLSSNKEAVEKKDFQILAAGGLLGITFLFLLHNIAITRTTSADANIVVACYPIIMIVVEIFGKKSKPGLAQIAGIILSIVGVLIVIGRLDNKGTDSRMFGNLLIFCAGIFWAFYNMATKRIVEKYSAFTVTFWQTLFGMLGLVALSLTEAARWRPPSSLTIVAAVYLSIACSIGAYLLYGIGLKKLRPGIAVNLMNLQPGFGVIIGVLLLGESITAIQVFGGFFIIIGVVISVRFAKYDNAKIA